MLRNRSELRVFTWAEIVCKPALSLFDYSMRDIDPTAKYDGLPVGFSFFNFLVFNFLVFVFSFFGFCFSLFGLCFSFVLFLLFGFHFFALFCFYIYYFVFVFFLI